MSPSRSPRPPRRSTAWCRASRYDVLEGTLMSSQHASPSRSPPVIPPVCTACALQLHVQKLPQLLLAGSGQAVCVQLTHFCGFAYICCRRRRRRRCGVRMQVTVPPDFDLEDLAELPQTEPDKREAMLGSYRLRYGSSRVDCWLGMTISRDWRRLAEDAIFARLEETAVSGGAWPGGGASGGGGGGGGGGVASMLRVEWVQEPPWGPCEWLNLHKLKDGE
jgi:uncharacterized membrane protein YgcG